MPTGSDSNEESEGFKLYHYNPTFAGAVVCAILFTMVSIYHAHILFRKRTWFFIPFLIGCLFEAFGYAARAYSSKETPEWTLMPYVMQSMLILLGPAFYAASIYMLLGRLICFLEAQSHSLVRTQWLTKLFLLGGVLSIFAQGGGGGLLAGAGSKSTQDLGIQVIFFSAFIIVTCLFHLRITKRPTVKSRGTLAPWKRIVMALYIVSALIMVRSVFRMVEYAQGHNGALIKKEIYVYVLDALLMIIVAIVFVVCHPSVLFTEHKAMTTEGENSDAIPMFGRYASIA